MKKLSLLVFSIFCHSFLVAQNTVGLITPFDTTEVAQGYNLFFSHNQSTTHLVNNCGEIVHTWTDEPQYRPGNMVYLLENGDLVKCKRPSTSAVNDPIWAGGGGEIVEQVDWDGNLKWSFRMNNQFERLHHDVAVMPNGNVLMIAWELKTFEESIQAGRDPEKLSQEKLWPDYILEYNPTLDSTVWEWHAWDHLIQDFDASKDNFGVVSEHPELIDLNYDTKSGHPDWLHSNSIDYNAELDQILLSVPHFDEIWILDHSTTTEEARGHSGGRSGKGGDLLFRWGNPATYRVVGPQQVFFAHDAHWLDDFLPSENSFYGAIMLFNNRVAENTISTVDIIRPAYNIQTGQYEMKENLVFLPNTTELTLFHPDTFPLHSAGLSSAQLLPNQNILALAGRTGHAFEINSSTNEVVWEYKIPLIRGTAAEQGAILEPNNNNTFRIKRYPIDFAAFAGRDLTSKGYLELNPNVDFCNLMMSTSISVLKDLPFRAYPNPVDHILIIESVNEVFGGAKQLLLTDLTGRVVKEINFDMTSRKMVDVSELTSGIYLLKTANNIGLQKIVVY